MNLNSRIDAFVQLGQRMLYDSKQDCGSKFELTIKDASIHNPWFTSENVYYAIDSIANHWLTREMLNSFTSKYPKNYFEPSASKKVVVIMAGNIPFAGLHDLICILLTGHRFLGKVSSKDGHLISATIELLIEIEPGFKNLIELSEVTLHGFDAVIATGSDNSSRYFDYYFKNYPTIIRKHRNSIAVLSGNETEEELTLLSDDIFLYFGLGCRSISMLLVPIGYSFKELLKAFKTWQNLDTHNKYMNNYEFQKTMNLMNLIDHIDTDFMLLKQNDSIGSTVGVVHYKEYDNIQTALTFIQNHQGELQCVVGDGSTIPNAIPFGTCQNPSIDEFADGIDTIEFLAKL
ncbi:MAG: acyl-CoA reductase [Bacteroidales bacterium]|nr:MAG: acyl-CoA reductase [Bacteroidales bacterium]